MKKKKKKQTTAMAVKASLRKKAIENGTYMPQGKVFKDRKKEARKKSCRNFKNGNSKNSHYFLSF